MDSLSIADLIARVVAVCICLIAILIFIFLTKYKKIWQRVLYVTSDSTIRVFYFQIFIAVYIFLIYLSINIMLDNDVSFLPRFSNENTKHFLSAILILLCIPLSVFIAWIVTLILHYIWDSHDARFLGRFKNRVLFCNSSDMANEWQTKVDKDEKDARDQLISMVNDSLERNTEKNCDRIQSCQTELTEQNNCELLYVKGIKQEQEGQTRLLNELKGKLSEYYINAIEQIKIFNKNVCYAMEDNDSKLFTMRYLSVVRSIDELLPPPAGYEPWRIDNLPRGYHLCISTDSSMLKIDSPHSFLFHASQRQWASRYEKISKDGDYPGLVYLISNTENHESYFKLDRAIRSSAKLCHDTMEHCQKMLNLQDFDLDVPDNPKEGVADYVNAAHYNGEFTYPRAVRMVCADPESVVNVLYNHFDDFRNWLLTGSGSGVWNILFTPQSRKHMNVNNWMKNIEVSTEFFYHGEYNENGITNNLNGETAKNESKVEKDSVLSFYELVELFKTAWKSDKKLGYDYTIEEDDASKNLIEQYSLSTKFELEPPALLAVGDKCRMIGPKGERTPENDEPRHCRGFFLQVLPITIMAMHCKKLISLDWLYRVIMMDRKKALRVGALKRNNIDEHKRLIIEKIEQHLN